VPGPEVGADPTPLASLGARPHVLSPVSVLSVDQRSADPPARAARLAPAALAGRA